MSKPPILPSRWTTKSGVKLAISDVDEDHIRAAEAMIMRYMGPELMLYEMARILTCDDPSTINLGSGPYNVNAVRWRYLCAFRRELKRRENKHCY